MASVQASPGSAVDDPSCLFRLAQASLASGVKVLRLEGVPNIAHIRQGTNAPIIGLVKRQYAGSAVYITPTREEVSALLELGCEVIALDGTRRTRPHAESLADLVGMIHKAGRLAMADCDDLDAARHASEAGADLIGTTLSGYTGVDAGPNPDLAFVRQLCAEFPETPVVAEGRYSEPWQARMALRAGAAAVVVGGALNDPVKQTRAFAASCDVPDEPVGAIDIGGTWLRAGIIAPDGSVLAHERLPVPLTRLERNTWINAWIQRTGMRRVGIGAGGVIRPDTGEVVFSKPIINDHVGTKFREEIHADQVVALNDGHATAWAHALHPEMAGRKVATLALGTGLGFGLVNRGRILMGRDGQHPRINDTPTSTGKIFDDLLGGANVTANPSVEAIRGAIEAAEEAIRLVLTLYYPDIIVIAGGIGLQPWMDLGRLKKIAEPYAEVSLTPYGSDAGLVGAGFLALYPPPLD